MKPIELISKKGISKMDPFKILQDKKHFIVALLECFEENDHEALIEILDGYIAVYNKTEFAQKVNISRSTLYDMLNGKKIRLFEFLLNVFMN